MGNGSKTVSSRCNNARRVTARVDETLSSLLVIVITPDPAVLVVIMQPQIQRLSLHVADDVQE